MPSLVYRYLRSWVLVLISILTIAIWVFAIILNRPACVSHISPLRAHPTPARLSPKGNKDQMKPNSASESNTNECSSHQGEHKSSEYSARNHRACQEFFSVLDLCFKLRWGVPHFRQKTRNIDWANAKLWAEQYIVNLFGVIEECTWVENTFKSNYKFPPRTLFSFSPTTMVSRRQRADLWNWYWKCRNDFTFGPL